MDQWHAAILGHLAEARAQGDVGAAVDDSAVAGHLLNMLLGAQITAALAPDNETDLGLGDQLEAFLTLLQAGS
jgi:hypothetical protein